MSVLEHGSKIACGKCGRSLFSRSAVSLLLCQLDEMFIPDPSDLVGGIILIFGKPQLSFLTNHVEYLRLK